MKLFFDHIPKTAGTSLREFFAEALGDESVSPTVRNLKLPSALALYSNKFIIIGHFGFIPGDELPKEYVNATVLRDPRERTLSDHYFRLYDVPEYNLSPIELKIKALPAEEAFSDPEVCVRFWNYQAVHFASFFHLTPRDLSEEELLELAKRGLDQYDLVGTTERLSEFVEEIKRIFKLPKNIILKRYNVTSTRKKFSELSPELQKRIEELNRVDMELWRYANWLFDHKTKYFELSEKPSSVSLTRVENASIDVTPVSTEDDSLELLEVTVKNRACPGRGFLAGEEALLRIVFRCHKDVDELTVGYSIHHDSGVHVFGVNTRLMGYELRCKAGRDYVVEFAFPVNLGIGTYRINVSAHTGYDHLRRCFFWKEGVAEFTVDGFLDTQFEGLVRLTPVCCLDQGFEVLSIVDKTTGFKRIGFNTPPLRCIKGSIRALTDVPPVRPGEQFSLMVEVSNEGSEDWLSEGTRPVNISYHWLDSEGNMVIFDGFRTPLPGRRLAAGDTVRCGVFIEAPKEPGRYILELTLVQELVCWFEERGFEPARFEVQVG